jgi:hypothetical protein
MGIGELENERMGELENGGMRIFKIVCLFQTKEL